jgi:DNA-binding PadR family transcriptional regulator
MSPNIRHSLSIEHALLGFLRQGPLHGYQIYQLISTPGGLSQVWRIKQSQLYALLARLDETGFIHGTLQIQESRPARRMYALTPEGESAYQEWLVSPVSVPRQIRQEFLVKLFFARQEGARVYAALVEAQRAATLRWLENLDRRSAPGRETDPQGWLVHQYRRHHIRAILDWLELCETAAAKSAVPVQPEQTGIG